MSICTNQVGRVDGSLNPKSLQGAWVGSVYKGLGMGLHHDFKTCFSNFRRNKESSFCVEVFQNPPGALKKGLGLKWSRSQLDVRKGY